MEKFRVDELWVRQPEFKASPWPQAPPHTSRVSLATLLRRPEWQLSDLQWEVTVSGAGCWVQ